MLFIQWQHKCSKMEAELSDVRVPELFPTRCMCTCVCVSQHDSACLDLGQMVHWSMCVFLPYVNTVKQSHSCRFYKQCMSITHALPLCHTHTHTHSLVWPPSKRAGVRGEWLWERGGLVAWNCRRPDKLTGNMYKRIYTISPGQYPLEESTIRSAAPHWAWNNTTHAETTPQPGLSQHAGQSLKQHRSVSSTTQCLQWETIHQVLTQPSSGLREWGLKKDWMRITQSHNHWIIIVSIIKGRCASQSVTKTQ